MEKNEENLIKKTLQEDYQKAFHDGKNIFGKIIIGIPMFALSLISTILATVLTIVLAPPMILIIYIPEEISKTKTWNKFIETIKKPFYK